jgi:hypothetical protein
MTKLSLETGCAECLKVMGAKQL